MTIPALKQLRALANAYADDREDRQEVLAALRAAADRLEEANDVLPLAISKLDRAGYHSSAQQLRYLITADTTLQEGLSDD